jgi:hypothetical protein
MPFKKGVSGNPSGRPKNTGDTAEVRLLARQHGPEAIKRLAAIMRDEKAHRRDQIDACNSLLDRGYGKSISAADMAAITHALNRNDDGGEVVIQVGWGKDGQGGRSVPLDQFAQEAAKPKDVTPTAPPTRQIEDLRPTKVSKSLSEKQADLDRLNLEISRLRAVLEGRAADWDESGWSHTLPPSSGPDWPGRTR